MLIKILFRGKTSKENSFYCNYSTKIQSYFLNSGGQLAECSSECVKCEDETQCIACSAESYKNWKVIDGINTQSCTQCLSPASECSLYRKTDGWNYDNNQIIYSDFQNISDFISKTTVIIEKCESDSFVLNASFICEKQNAIDQCVLYRFSDGNDNILTANNVPIFLRNNSAFQEDIISKNFALKCFVCNSSFFLNSPQICQKCADNCLKCPFDYCEKCSEDSYLNNGSCTKCSTINPYCSTCGLALFDSTTKTLLFNSSNQTLALYCFSCTQGYGIIRSSLDNLSTPFNNCSQCQKCSECFFYNDSQENCLNCFRNDSDFTQIAVLNFNTLQCQNLSREIFANSSLQVAQCLQAGTFFNSTVPYFCMRCASGYSPIYNLGCFACPNCFEKRVLSYYSFINYNYMNVNFSDIISNVDHFNKYILVSKDLNQLSIASARIVTFLCDCVIDYALPFPSDVFYICNNKTNACISHCSLCSTTQCFSCGDYKISHYESFLFNISNATDLTPNSLNSNSSNFSNSSSSSSSTSSTSSSSASSSSKIDPDAGVTQWNISSFENFSALIFQVLYVSSLPNATLSTYFNGSQLISLLNTPSFLSYKTPSYYDDVDVSLYLKVAEANKIIKTSLYEYNSAYGGDEGQKCLPCKPGCGKCSKISPLSDVPEDLFFLGVYQNANCDFCSSDKTIYDWERKTCRYCPKNWKNCRATFNQTIYIDFSVNSSYLPQNNDDVMVNTLDDLLTILSYFNSTQTYYTFGEFYVETFELKLLFKYQTDSFLFPADKNYSQLQNITGSIPDLRNNLSLSYFSLIIGCYENDSLSNTLIECTHSHKANITVKNFNELYFSDLDNFEIRNLRFIINDTSAQPNYILIINNTVNASMENLEFIAPKNIAVKSNFINILNVSLVIFNNITIQNISKSDFNFFISMTTVNQIKIHSFDFLNVNFTSSSSGIVFIIDAKIFEMSESNFSQITLKNINLTQFSQITVIGVFSNFNVQNGYFYQSSLVANSILKNRNITISNFSIINNTFESDANSKISYSVIGIDISSISNLYFFNNTLSTFSFLILDVNQRIILNINNVSAFNNNLTYGITTVMNSLTQSLILVSDSSTIGNNQQVLIQNISIILNSEPVFTLVSQSFINMQNLLHVTLIDWEFNFNLENKSFYGTSGNTFNYFMFSTIIHISLNNFKLQGIRCPTSNSLHSIFFKFQVLNSISIVNLTSNSFNVKYALIYIDNKALIISSQISIQSSTFFLNYITLTPTAGSLIVLKQNAVNTRIYFTIYNTSFLASSTSLIVRPSILSSGAYSSNLTFNSSIFDYNNAPLFKIDGEDVLIFNCSFKNIKSSSASSYAIGTFRFIKFNITQSVFQNNAISMFDFENLLAYSHVSLNNLWIFNISSTNPGSSFYFKSEVNELTSITANNIIVSQSSCQDSGILFYFYGRGNFSLSIDQLSFSNSLSKKDGTILFVELASNFSLILSNSIVNDLQDALAIALKVKNNLHSYFSNVTITNLKDQSQFLSVIIGTVILHNCNFVGNVYGYSGLINVQNADLFNVSESKFILNSFNQEDSNSLSYNVDLSPYLKSKGFNVIIVSMIVVIEGNFQLSLSHFENNSCFSCSGGVIAFLGQKSFFLNLTHSMFINNSALAGGSIYLYQIVELNLSNPSIMQNNTFKSNRGYFGAAIYVAFVNLNLTNTFFLYNSAVNISNNSDFGKGGALLYEASLTSKNVLFLLEVTFKNCTANVGGAMFMTAKEYKTTNNSQIHYENNSVSSHGSNCFSFPTGIKILYAEGDFKTNQNYGYFYEFKPGGSISSLILALVDQDKNRISSFETEPTITLTLKCVQQLNTSCFPRTISLYRNSTSDIFVMSSQSFSGNYSNDYSMVLSSDLTNANSTNCVQYSDLVVPINFRKCVLGELYKDNSCEMCNNKYTLEWRATICKVCDLTKMKSCNGSSIQILPGFWRSGLQTDNIQKCVIDGVCMGDDSLGNQKNITCLTGHIGGLCQACDTYGTNWGDRYYKVSDYICKKCSDFDISTVIFVILFVFNILIMAVTAKGMQEMIDIEQKLKVIKSTGFLFARYQANNKQIYVKTIVNYFQIVSVINSLNLKIPDILKIITKTIGNPSDILLHAGDCYISEIFNRVPLVYSRVFIITALPALYVLIYGAFYLIAALTNSLKAKPQVFYSAILFALVYLQPNVVDTIISVISCSQMTDKKYIKADPSYECYSEEHMYYILVVFTPSLFFWVLAFPVGLFGLILKEKNNLDKFIVKVKYGFIINEYRPNCFYWEFVKIFERIAIILFLNFFDTEIMIKGLLILLTIFIYFILLQYFRPYKTLEMHRVDYTSCFVCYFSIFFAIFAYANTSDVCLAVAYIFIIGANFYFLLFLFFKLISSFIQDHMKIREFLTKKIPISKTLLRLGTHLSTVDNWKRVRRVVSRYLYEKSKIQKVRMSLGASRNLRTELDEEILTLLRQDPNHKESNLSSEYNFRTEGIEEKKQEKEVETKFFFELQSPTTIPFKD